MYVNDDMWTVARHWYRYGNFEEAVWKVDKGVILHALETEAKEKRLEVCLVFSISSIKQCIETLPDEILMNDRWRILTRSEITNDDFKDISYGIELVSIEVDNNTIELIDWRAYLQSI